MACTIALVNKNRQWLPSFLQRTTGASALAAPLLVFVISLLVTGLLVASIANTIRRQDRSTFDNEVARTLDAIDQRIGTTSTLLRGTAGLFAAGDDVDLQSFRNYVKQLDLRERYPGILGVGFTRSIAAADLDRFEAEVRSEGIPDFRVWPRHRRDEYHSIVYLEPMDDRNRQAIGYDMSTNPVRRAAMLAAMQKGDVVASGKVTLVQEIDDQKQSGFLMYIPIPADHRQYGKGMAPGSGPLPDFVYSPLRAGDLLEGARGTGALLIDYEVFDGTEPAPEALLHSTLPGSAQTPRFSVDHVIEVVDRPWLVRFYSRPAHDALSQWWLIRWLALTALVTSLLLARLTWWQVSARRAAESAARVQRESADILHQEREWLRTILISIGDGVIAVDASGRIVLMNPVAERLTGWTNSQAEGRTLDEVVKVNVPSDDGLAPRSLLGAHGSAELLVQALDGQIRPIDQSSAPIHDATGFAAGAVIVMRDASERHRVEAELRGNDRRKDEFLAMLAHELRNPLAPICNSLELLRRQPSGEVAERARAVADRQARLMVRLVDDLLDLSRISRGAIVLHREPISVAEVLQTAIESSRPLIDRRQHSLSVGELDPGLRLDGDHARLAQVFTNLLNNAATYTEPGGRIELAARRDGDWVEIVVRDNGVGIDAATLPHLFDMFVQVDRSPERSGGLGIGLTLVRQLLQMHGGTVEARSAGLGAGSEFVVRLPLLADTVAAPERSTGHPACVKALRVLVVDDNPDTADSLAMMLRLDGHEVDVAYCGTEALRKAQATAPDAVLLDIGLPGMDGYQIARRLRAEQGNAVMLIAITGWGQQDDRHRARDAGFDHHLVKPVEPAALAALLGMACGRDGGDQPPRTVPPTA